MASECKKCGNKDNYNFALNIGLCNCCIGEKFEQLQAENEQQADFLSLAKEEMDSLQAKVKRLKDKKDVVSEICIPNLRPDEAQYVRGEVNRFVKDLLNKLAEQRKHRN